MIELTPAQALIVVGMADGMRLAIEYSCTTRWRYWREGQEPRTLNFKMCEKLKKAGALVHRSTSGYINRTIIQYELSPEMKAQIERAVQRNKKDQP